MLSEVPASHDLYSTASQVSPDTFEDLLKLHVSIEMEKYKKEIKEEEEIKKKKKEELEESNRQCKSACGYIWGFFLLIMIGAMCYIVFSKWDNEFPEHLIIVWYICGSLALLSCCYGTRKFIRGPKKK